MGIFKRLFKIGQANAHSMLDELEKPIQMTELGIRELKNDLDKALKVLAEVKATSIRATKDYHQFSNEKDAYEKKAIELLQKAKEGKISNEEAERLAKAALQRKQEIELRLDQTKTESSQYEKSVAKLEANVDNIKANIAKWENELKSLKARAKVSEVTKNVNKQLSKVDSSGTVSMLEKMKEKVESQEALAESYGEVAKANKSIDDEINAALNNNFDSNSALEELKAKMQ